MRLRVVDAHRRVCEGERSPGLFSFPREKRYLDCSCFSSLRGEGSAQSPRQTRGREWGVAPATPDGGPCGPVSTDIGTTRGSSRRWGWATPGRSEAECERRRQGRRDPAPAHPGPRAVPGEDGFLLQDAPEGHGGPRTPAPTARAPRRGRLLTRSPLRTEAGHCAARGLGWGPGKGNLLFGVLSVPSTSGHSPLCV